MPDLEKGLGTLQKRPHQLSLKNRESLSIEGVLNVESFDDQEVVLETEVGVLLVRGEDLHIKALSLDGGTLVIDGYVRGLEYQGDGPAERKGKGLFGRLFR